MNDHREHPDSKSLKQLYTDQLSEEGIKADSSASANRQAENYQKDLAEEDGQKDASWKAAPVPESEIQGEDNDLYNGMSQ